MRRSFFKDDNTESERALYRQYFFHQRCAWTKRFSWHGKKATSQSGTKIHEITRYMNMAFIREYIALRHMIKITLIPQLNTTNFSLIFISRITVIKVMNTTIKVRIIFNGSAKSSIGISLKDVCSKSGWSFVYFNSFSHISRRPKCQYWENISTNICRASAASLIMHTGGKYSENPLQHLNIMMYDTTSTPYLTMYVLI